MNFSISDVFTLTSAVVFGPAAGAVMVAVDCLAISYRLRERAPVDRILFNAVVPPLAMWLSAHALLLHCGPQPLSLAAPAFSRIPLPRVAAHRGAYFLLNTFAVALAVALHERVEHRGSGERTFRTCG